MSRSNPDDPPTLEYAGAEPTATPETPPLYFWLFMASLVTLIICIAAHSSGLTSPSGAMESAIRTILRVAVLAMNGVTIWSFVLLYRGYWKNTTIGFLAVVSAMFSVAGDIGLVVWLMM
ncbi:MAG TPA: hypothetical protein P5081_00475 [Phycisphaerae bacterium]|nr:hypothetical protein [Phycisphaerae bacterium]HRW51328.1 hypothetical protein [Phycisphaerae bacterium]